MASRPSLVAVTSTARRSLASGSRETRPAFSSRRTSVVIVDLSTESHSASFDMRTGPETTTRSSSQESVLESAAPAASCRMRRLSARVDQRRIVESAASTVCPTGADDSGSTFLGVMAECFLTKSMSGCPAEY
jgi:hypothetical protein